MGNIVAGIGTSHVPSIGVAYDKGEEKTDAWSPLFLLEGRDVKIVTCHLTM